MNNLYKFDISKLNTNNTLFVNKYNSIIGVDEVGRGSIAGPVVSVAVSILNYTNILEEVNDSKKLTPQKRKELYNKIINSKDIIYEIALKDEKIIDDINILNASLLSMKEACEKLIERYDLQNTLTLVDGNQLIPKYIYNQEWVIKGDMKSLSIATASIIAKVYRDNLMIEYSKKYDKYDLENNKGYGTKKHYIALEKYGITPIHRKTFLSKFYNFRGDNEDFGLDIL